MEKKTEFFVLSRCYVRDDELDALIASVEDRGWFIGGGGDEFVLEVPNFSADSVSGIVTIWWMARAMFIHRVDESGEEVSDGQAD